MSLNGPQPSSALHTLKRHARTFSFAGMFLSRRQLRASARLYRFCRFVDDIADGELDPRLKKQKLNLIRDQIHGGEWNDPVARDFTELMQAYGINPAYPDDLLAGLMGDSEESIAIKDEFGLVRYAYCVAGTVGLMMARILGATEFGAMRHARDLGIAMQLTNIARDVREDAERGRRYLPSTWTGDLSPSRVLDPIPEDEMMVSYAVEKLLARAERYYASGEAGLAYLPPRARYAIFVAGRLYREIGRKLWRSGSNPCEGRVVVSAGEKALRTVELTGVYLARRCFGGKPAEDMFSSDRPIRIMGVS